MIENFEISIIILFVALAIFATITFPNTIKEFSDRMIETSNATNLIYPSNESVQKAVLEAKLIYSGVSK